jgi:hypothetical protein
MRYAVPCGSVGSLLIICVDYKVEEGTLNIFLLNYCARLKAMQQTTEGPRGQTPRCFAARIVQVRLSL